MTVSGKKSSGVKYKFGLNNTHYIVHYKETKGLHFPSNANDGKAVEQLSRRSRSTLSDTYTASFCTATNELQIGLCVSRTLRVINVNRTAQDE